MSKLSSLAAIAAAALIALTTGATAQQLLSLRTGLLLDGKGGAARNQVIAIDGPRISAISTTTQPVTYDLSRLTILPGLIDTHVHIGAHFDKTGRLAGATEPPDEKALYDAESAATLLQAGFTTVQSIGAASDLALRDAIARGRFPARASSPRPPRSPTRRSPPTRSANTSARPPPTAPT